MRRQLAELRKSEDARQPLRRATASIQAALFNCRGEHFFHRWNSTSGDLRLINAGIGPDRVRNATVRGDASVVSLLVTVIDGATRKDTIAVVLVGCDGRDP